MHSLHRAGPQQCHAVAVSRCTLCAGFQFGLWRCGNPAPFNYPINNLRNCSMQFCTAIPDAPHDIRSAHAQVKAGIWYGPDGQRRVVSQYHETMGFFLGKWGRYIALTLVCLDLLGTNIAQVPMLHSSEASCRGLVMCILDLQCDAASA